MNFLNLVLFVYAASQLLSLITGTRVPPPGSERSQLLIWVFLTAWTFANLQERFNFRFMNRNPSQVEPNEMGQSSLSRLRQSITQKLSSLFGFLVSPFSANNEQAQNSNKEKMPTSYHSSLMQLKLNSARRNATNNDAKTTTNYSAPSNDQHQPFYSHASNLTMHGKSKPTGRKEQDCTRSNFLPT